jgi:nitrogen fixation protein NifU and related proteins
MTTEVHLGSLYQQVILDHYRKPRNRGELPDRTVAVVMRNPSCGDEITLQLKLEDDIVADVRYLGEGCSISQASVSMMSTIIKGRPVDEALALAERFNQLMHGDKEVAKDRSLKDLRALQGVSKFPVRIKCALLGFDALQEAVKRTRGEGDDGGDGADGDGPEAPAGRAEDADSGPLPVDPQADS